MKHGLISLAAVTYITFATAQKCNITYIDETGYFPLSIEEIPPEKCPQNDNCCWCSSGNATSTEASCCLTIACNAAGIKSFEEFAISVCSVNVGITSPGKMTKNCPARGTLHSSLKMMTSITAESISPSSTARGLSPTSRIEEDVKSSQLSETSIADQRKTAIAVSASLVGSVIISLLVLFLWRRRQVRKPAFSDLGTKASELPTSSNIHEIEGRALSIKQSKPCEIMSRSIDRIPTPISKITPSRTMPPILAPLSTAKIWEQQNTTMGTQAEIRRLAETSPGSCQSLLLNRSPDGWMPTPCTPSDRSSSFALSIKPLPPPPPRSGFARGMVKGGRYSDLQKALPVIGLEQR